MHFTCLGMSIQSLRNLLRKSGLAVAAEKLKKGGSKLLDAVSAIPEREGKRSRKPSLKFRGPCLPENTPLPRISNLRKKVTSILTLGE